ncbi:MAG: hypothetical protein ACOCUW_02685 [Gemmatimonadota bacterium]
MRRALVPAALVAGLLSVAPGAAQEAGDLDGLLDTLGSLWARGDAAALARHGVDAGLDLEVHGELMGPLEGRRAAAALRQLFGGQETVSVQPGAAARVVGAEDRAFAEFVWMVRTPGSVMAERNKIFLALVLEDGDWRVSQIRILRPLNR